MVTTATPVFYPAEHPPLISQELRNRVHAILAPTPLQLVLLEAGDAGAKSLKEIAARDGIDNSYVSRMVATPAPDIVTGILDDTMPNHITLFDLAVDPPALWDEQRERIWH